MLNDENKKLCEEVFKKYGSYHQILKLGEECTELAQAIFRVAQDGTNEKTIYNLVEEFIDVYVMQERLIRYFRERGYITVNQFNEFAKFKLKKALEEKDEVD